MATKPKVFISYSTKDRATAEALYTDLLKAGADVFEFERSAKPGSSAWDEVLGWIESSDVFIMLVSRSALKSRPVREEVEYAYYKFVNSDATRPGKLIPALLEQDIQPPRVLERFTGLALYNYATGIKQLIAGLGLETPPKPVDAAHEKQSVPTKTVSKDSLAPSGQKRAAVPGLQGSPRVSPRLRTPYWSQPVVHDLLSAQSSQAQPSTFSQKLGTPRPGTAKVSVTSHVGRYLAVIGIITLIGAIAGLWASSFLRSFALDQLEPVTGLIRSWSESASWLPLISVILICLILARNAWVTSDNNLPTDSYDYALISVKSLVVALVLASLWILLFSQTVTQDVSTIVVLVCTLTTMGTVAVYAILNEW